MMEAALPRSWKEQFALAAAIREEDIKHREKLIRFDARQRQITEEQRIAAKKRDAEAREALETVLASPARIAEFHVKLDSYDAKTVEALMENQEAMDRVRQRLDDMLGKAHVLPDGRRVFKTEDGQKVFDETGQEVERETVDPSGIDDRKPKWEQFKGKGEEWQRLSAERQGLLDYQAKLDNAREQAGKNDLTEGDLDRMQDDLRESMPEAVRVKVEPDKPKAEVAPTTSPMPDGLDALMRQTGLGPSPSAGLR